MEDKCKTCLNNKLLFKTWLSPFCGVDDRIIDADVWLCENYKSGTNKAVNKPERNLASSSRSCNSAEK